MCHCFTCVDVSCLCSENGLQLTFIYYIALSIGFIHTVYAAKTSLSDKSSSMALTSGLALLEPITLATNGDLTSSSSWSRPATPREPAIKSARTKCSSYSVGLSPSSSVRFAAIRSSRGTIGAPRKAWISLSQSKSYSSSSERPSNTASSKFSSKTLPQEKGVG